MSETTLNMNLLSQVTNGFWHYYEVRNSQAKEDTDELVPIKEKSVSFSFYRQDKFQAARRILREALHNPDALDAIKERAAIRWSNGLSDSLFNAVLCNLKPLNENAERDSKGNIILKPQTDWEAELRKFEA